MMQFFDCELENINAAVESWFYDRCSIIKNASTEADDGELIVSDGTTSTTPCRWSPVSTSENSRGPLVLSDSRWRLVVPRSVSLSHLDRVRLLSKMGVDLVQPIDTQVDGIPQPIVGAFQVNLRAMET